MNLQKLEQWLDAKSWLGWPRAAWCVVALAIGICLNLYIAHLL